VRLGLGTSLFSPQALSGGAIGNTSRAGWRSISLSFMEAIQHRLHTPAKVYRFLPRVVPSSHLKRETNTNS